MIQTEPAYEYPNCVAIRNDDAELLITTDVGPRILRYRLLPDGENLFKTYEKDLGGQNEFEWKLRGGHRLWIAPEDNSLTYVPDNVAIPWEQEADLTATFLNPAAPPWSMEKSLQVSLDSHGSRAVLVHQITNRSEQALAIAPWALTVMRPGGFMLTPQPPLGEHPRDLLPNRRWILWPYTDPGDPRWRYSEKFLGLRQEHSADVKPIKMGLGTEEGCAIYVHGNTVFYKSFDFDADATYPDFGCNFETFTDANMLEVESLGPLVSLEPEQTVEHREEWKLMTLDDVPDFQDDAGWSEVLERLHSY